MEKTPTLANIIEHQNAIYGIRNRIRFQSIQDRIFFLFVAASDFKKLVRKKKEKPFLAHGLARIFSRIICVAEYYGPSIPLAECFTEKWLAATCRYCGKMPCECRAAFRPDAVLHPMGPEYTWELREAAGHINALYGANNRKDPIDVLYSRLVEEISEIITGVVDMPVSLKSNTDLLRELALELSDAIAWVLAISNYLEVDLQDYYLSRYADGCAKCQSLPCECGAFLWPSVGEWEAATVRLR
ncbi:MAG TPA: hypothetical protein VLA04_00595 [Verrucomicrobiae bacterium]|nr:hypothetical protein [Verrucomicrobiae bacterium]